MLYLLGLLVSLASAQAPHWVWPEPRDWAQTGKRVGPCGSSGSRLGTITQIAPGPLTVTWEEPVNNKGSNFRIALSNAGVDQFESCILLDYIPHNDDGVPTANAFVKYSMTIEIPDVSCTDCALQLVNVVPGNKACTYDPADTMNGLNGRCSENYHSCANVQITGGQYQRSAYTCQKNTNWPFSGPKYKQSAETWYNQFLMDPAVPSQYRNVNIGGKQKEGVSRNVVSNQYDDAMENLANDKVMRADAQLSFTPSRIVGLRFRDVLVPPGMEIVDARLSLWFSDSANSTASGTPSPVQNTLLVTMLSMEKNPNSAAIQKINTDISSRPVTSGQTIGHIVQQQLGWWKSPDLKSVVQEVVDLPGWASGNAMTVIVDIETGSRLVDTFESGHPAELEIVYRKPVKAGQSAPPTPAPIAGPSGPCTYQKHERILGNYLANGDWYPGRIEVVYPNSAGIVTGCTYDIIYDDGDMESQVSDQHITPETVSSRSGFQLRELVDVKQKGVWQRSMVRILQKNGLYTVEDMNTGSIYMDVNGNDMRQWVEYYKGDVIEIKQCWWFKATIQKVLPDGRYECVMDDGYFANVVYPDVREIIAVRYQSGDNVKLFINQQWVDGFVIMPNADGTYMVGVSGSPRIETSWPASKMTKTSGSG